MDKNEILEKSRKENKGYDERELWITAKAWQLGGAVGIIICGLASLFLAFFCDLPMKYAADNMAIYFGMLAAVCVFKAIKLRKPSDIALAAVFSGFFIFYAATFVAGFVN